MLGFTAARGRPLRGSRARKAKRTAERLAFARAVGRRDSEILNPDFLAERMIGFPFNALLVPGLRQLAVLVYDFVSPGSYLYLQARAKYLDDLFLAAIRDVRQCVILGAGFDTRPYRFADRLSGIRVFEVDHPGTAALKLRRVHRLGCSTEHVTYVPIDFNRDRLDERLRQVGYDPAMTTFFLWEGVIMYLPSESVDETMAFIAGAAPGSSVAFDYVYRSSLERPREFHGAERWQRYVKSLDEPCRFALDPEEVSSFLSRHGLAVTSNAGPKELSRLLPPRPFLDFLGIVHARRDAR